MGRLIARSPAQELRPFSNQSRFFVPTMVMNYDTYLEIDQDSDSGFPVLPGGTYKKRRHDEKIPSQKIRLTVWRAKKL